MADSNKANAQVGDVQATAAVKAYKCLNCAHVNQIVNGFDFEAADPVCPKCGVDGRDEAGSRQVLPRVVVHFDPPSKVFNRGRGTLACAPKFKVLNNGQGIRASGDYRAVSCERCKATSEFKAAATATTDLSNAVDLSAV